MFGDWLPWMLSVGFVIRTYYCERVQIFAGQLTVTIVCLVLLSTNPMNNSLLIRRDPNAETHD